MKYNLLKSLTILLIAAFTVSGTHAAELEDRISALDGTSSYVDGPNCWNGAMYAAGVVDSLRMFHPAEWLYHLENSCTEVETPEYGDVGRLSFKESEVHGFIYLSEGEIFAKHGEQVMWGYSIMPMQEMLDTYERTRECRINNDYSKECYHTLKYYRCKQGSRTQEGRQKFESSLEALTRAPEIRPTPKMNCESAVFLERERLIRSMISNSSFLGQIQAPLKVVLLKSYNEQLYRLLVKNRVFRCKDRSKRDQSFKELRSIIDRFNLLD